MPTKPKKPVYSASDGKPTSIAVADIVVDTRLRTLNEDLVAAISKSMLAVGLKTPITVRRDGTGKGWALVAGWHRLEAARHLDWREIPADVMVGDEKDARIWEIAENLHRAELTALERAKHISEWVRLVGSSKR